MNSPPASDPAMRPTTSANPATPVACPCCTRGTWSGINAVAGPLATGHAELHRHVCQHEARQAVDGHQRTQRQHVQQHAGDKERPAPAPTDYDSGRSARR